MNGWVILDKPAGMTSTKAGSIIKRLFQTKKLGHVGTLDPFATGLLPMALGEATKLIPYIDTDTKTYTFELTWGVQTTTGDPEGEVVSVSPHRPDYGEIQGGISRFLGEITQIPPAYSAIRIGGERAYTLARSGQVVDIPPRVVRIHGLTLTEIISKDKAVFEVTCSAGTYVRTLGQDLALALDTVGMVSQLRRTRVGIFTSEMMISLAQIEKNTYNQTVESACLPLGAALDDIPAVPVSSMEREDFRHGRPIKGPDLLEGVVSVWHDGQLVGMARAACGLINPMRFIHS